MYPDDPNKMKQKKTNLKSTSGILYALKGEFRPAQMSLTTEELDDPVSYLNKLVAELDESMIKRSPSGDNLEIYVEGKVFCTVKVSRPDSVNIAEVKEDIGVITIDLHAFDPSKPEHQKAMNAFEHLKCDFIVERCSSKEDAAKLIKQFPRRLTFEYGEGKVPLELQSYIEGLLSLENTIKSPVIRPEVPPAAQPPRTRRAP